MGQLVEPEPEFHDRVVQGVRTRIDDYGTASVVADLLGLGFHVGRAMLPPDDDPGSAR